MSSTNFVSLRMKNLKFTDLAAAHGHNTRTIDVPNARPDGHHERVFGDPALSLEELLMARLKVIGADFERMGVKKEVKGDDLSELSEQEIRRRLTTVVNEHVVSASPEFFRPGRAGEAGTYDQERLEQWVETVKAWADKEFGDNLLSIDLHCDETTPHAHVCVAPLVHSEKNLRRTKAEIAAGAAPRTAKIWKFHSSEIHDKEGLRLMQDRAAASFAHLGLHRGIPSKIRHETTAALMNIIHQAQGNIIPDNKEKLKSPSVDNEFEPSILNIGKTREWIGKAKKIVKYLRAALKKETARADENRNLYEEKAQAAQYYQEKYLRLREAQVAVFDQCGNDPVAAKALLEDLARRIDAAHKKGISEGHDSRDDEISSLRRWQENDSSLARDASQKLVKAEQRIEQLEGFIRGRGRDIPAPTNELKR